EQGDAARLSELERADGVLVDEGLLDGGRGRREPGDHPGETLEDGEKAFGQIAARTLADAVRDMGGAPGVEVDDAPARAPQAGIDPDHTHRLFLSLPALAREPSTKPEHPPAVAHAGARAPSSLRHRP